jgi:hypothetical protein
MLGGYCRGQPKGSPKRPGGSCLKPARNAKRKTHLEPNTKHAHTAQPTPQWPPRPTRAVEQGAPLSKAPLERGPPRSRAHAPSSRLPPRSRVLASLERAPPRSRFPHEHTGSRTRVRAFNALTRQSCATTRLGITPRRRSANPLGGAHPHHCGELCDEAGVSYVSLCCPLLYG